MRTWPVVFWGGEELGRAARGPGPGDRAQPGRPGAGPSCACSPHQGPPAQARSRAAHAKSPLSSVSHRSACRRLTATPPALLRPAGRARTTPPDEGDVDELAAPLTTRASEQAAAADMAAERREVGDEKKRGDRPEK